MRETTRLHLVLAFTAVCFGAFPVVGKLALAEIPPHVLAALRVTAAATIFQTLRHVTTGERIAGGRELSLFALAALLGVVLNQGFFLLGLSRTSAIHTVLLVATIPAFSYAAGVVLGREALLRGKVLGIALAFAGVAVLLAARDLGGAVGPQASLLGDLLVAANSLSYGVYLVVSRPLARTYQPTTVVAWIFTFGVVVFVPLALAVPVAGRTLATLAWGSLSLKAWAALAWIIVFPTGIAYYLSSWALRRADASLVAAYVFLQPVVTTVLAIPVLGERPGWLALVAAAAIFGGVTAIARAKPRPEPGGSGPSPRGV